MNYSGNFDATFPVDGSGLHSNGYVHVETVSPHTTHAPADAIVVPDAHLLFNGDFKRSGVDLILSKDDQELVLHDYFKGEKRAALASPDGAHLSGDIVNALTGHVEYAQADGSASVSKVIGHVTKLAGTATAVRNGVSIILNQGDNVEKGDVVQSGSGSTLGITFIDGTVFGLSSNARMVLNEMVYDPNGSNNSSLLSLVAGTITFVAGETAKHGDMKVDTPVATMGIRGTAVLVEIDFDVPGQGGLPDAKFQVLVEPDGTTGSYILFDKTTLTPLAIVDKAGQQINISNGSLTQSQTGLSSEIQKLITDVFSIKFTDTNTKTFDHHTDTPIPETLSPIKLAGPITVTPVILPVNTPVNAAPQNSSGPSTLLQHIDQAPTVATFNASFTELPGVTGSHAFDTASGKVSFVDINAGDSPTVSTKFVSFTYQNAEGVFTSANLSNAFNTNISPKTLSDDIAAVEANLVVVADPGNKNTGSATWTYSVADGAFDFLAAGETLTLKYNALVNNNYLPNDAVTITPFTITITGANDVPVITTGPQTIGFVGGKDTSGGDLIPNAPTKGTLTFIDADLTDTHTVSVKLASALLAGNPIDKLAPGPLSDFETALSASIANDSTGTGTGTVTWNLAELPVFDADFIPAGEALVLTYTVEVKDSQNAISTPQTVTVTIGGNNTPAVVWIDTKPAPSTGALWSDGSNWETGNAPTINDDAIIITNQLQPNFPTYPVVIDTTASAKSLAMNDVTGKAPVLDNNSTLTIAGGLTLNVDAVVNNFGNISVGSLATALSISGLAEILDQSVLNNSGTINLTQGGDFIDHSSITNSGTIEISGGKLDVEVAVANAGGTIQVDSGKTLALSDGSKTTQGKLTLGSGSTLDVESTGGATLDGVGVTGTDAVTGPPAVAASLIEIGASTTSGSILTLDDNTVITNGHLTIGSNSTLDIEKGTASLLAGVPDATLDGVNVMNSGSIQVDSAVGGTTTVALLLDGGTTVTGGTLTIHVPGSSAEGIVEIGTGGATLDDVTVDNNNILTIDSGATLTLSGTEIIGGTINDNSTIDVTSSSEIDGGAALNNGAVTVESGKILTLDNITVNGTTITDKGTIVLDDTVKLTGAATLQGASSTALGAITNNGTLEVAGAADLLNDTLTDTSASGSIIQVDDGATLTLSGTEIIGGAINDNGKIDITGSSTINGYANLNNGAVTVESGKTLTLDNVTVNGTTFTDPGTIKVEAGQTLTLAGTDNITGGQFAIGDGKVQAAGNAVLFSGVSVGDLNTGNPELTLTVTASGSLAATSLAGLTIIGGFNGASGTLEVTGTLAAIKAALASGLTYDPVGTSNTLTMTVDDGSGDTAFRTVTIDAPQGGTPSFQVTNSSGAIRDANLIDITGTTTLSSDEVFNGSATLKVEANALLKLIHSGTHGGTITDNGTIEIAGQSGINVASLNIGINGVLLVDSGKLLTVNNSTVTGGTVTDNGTIEIITSSAINSGSLSNGGVTVDANQTLTLDDVKVNGTVFTDTASGAILQIDSGDTLTFNGATIDGGTLNVSGEMDSSGISFITAATIVNVNNIAVVSGTLTIDPTPVTNTGTIEVKGDSTLVLSGETITNTDGTKNGTIQVDADPTHTATLDLDGSTINGGKVTISGVLDSTGSSFITGAAITNSGIVDVTSGTGTISGTTSFVNSGTVEANGAELDLVNTTVTDTNGTVEAIGTGVLKFESATINGGTLGGPGTIATVSGVDTLNGVAIAGGTTVNVTDNTALDLKGTIVNGGTIALNSSGDATQLEISGNVSLNGSGQVTLTDNANDANNLIVSDGLAAKLTNSDTIAGAGTIGDTHLTLVNDGTIDATGTHLLTIDTGTNTATSAGPAGSHWTVGSLTVTNNAGGILEASAGHTLQIDDNVLNSGLIEAGNAGDSSVAVVNITGNITGTGSIELFQNADIEIGGSVSFGQTVTFATAGAAATLVLDNSHDFYGAIDGLVEASNDSLENQVDLKDLTYRPGHMFAFFEGFFDTVTVGNGIDFVSLRLSGSPSDSSFALSADGTGGTLMHDPSVSSGTVTIDSGQTLDISAASTATVSFTNSNSNAGELVLDNSNAFTGQIVGFAGDGTISNSDTINLTDVSIADVATDKTTYTENGNGTGTLTLHDTNGQALDSITFAGSYQLANFTIENDGRGHVLIVDPPVPSGNATMQNPGPAASSTIVASAPNQILTGNAASDTFAFNFAGVGHTTVTDFHPTTDMLQFSSQLFANVQAALNATHDDGHGNTVISLDAHDAITLSGVLKAQLHASDFHFV